MSATAPSASATLATKHLTAEQLEFFDREGYLIAENVLDDSDLQPVIDEIHAEVNARAKQLVAEGKLSSTFEEYGFARQLTMISRETDQVASSIWNGALCGPAFFDLIRNEKLLDVAESLCGPELIASSVYRLRPKIPGHASSAVPWHQDSGYMEPYCDKPLVLTYWIPLVDATKENGCMWVMPRVHKNEEVLLHQGRPGKPYLEIPETALPKGEPICAEIKKGGVLLLSNRTPHASFDNNTDLVRWSMDLRYQSAVLPTNAPITRLPDEILSSEEKGVPLACYPPEADCLIRSRQRPNQVVSSAAEFQRIRKTYQYKPVTPRWK